MPGKVHSSLIYKMKAQSYVAKGRKNDNENMKTSGFVYLQNEGRFVAQLGKEIGSESKKICKFFEKSR
jgi:hypothetical protein